MSNSTIAENTSSSSKCNAVNPEYCLYRLPCGTCMMLKSSCPHINNNSKFIDESNYKLSDYYTTKDSYIPDSCKFCSNHPNNGGNGNCNCTLGDYKIT